MALTANKNTRTANPKKCAEKGEKEYVYEKHERNNERRVQHKRN